MTISIKIIEYATNHRLRYVSCAENVKIAGITRVAVTGKLGLLRLKLAI